MVEQKEQTKLYLVNTVVSRFFLGFICMYTIAKFLGDWSTMSWPTTIVMAVFVWGASIVIYDEIIDGHYKELWDDNYIKAKNKTKRS